MNFRSGSLVVCVGFAFAADHVAAAQSTLGWKVAVKMSPDSGGGSTGQSVVATILKLNGRTRVDLTSSAIGGPPPGFHAVIDSLDGTLTTVSSAGRVAVIFPPSGDTLVSQPIFSMEFGAKSQLSVSTVAGKPFVTMKLEGTPSLVVDDLGAGEQILGFSTHRYRETSVSVERFTVGEESCALRTTSVAEVWTTSDPNVPDIANAITRVMGGEANGVRADNDKSIVVLTRERGVTGVILRSIVRSSDPASKSDSLGARFRQEITSVQRETLDPSLFAIPADYHVVDTRKPATSVKPESKPGDKSVDLMSGGTSICSRVPR